MGRALKVTNGDRTTCEAGSRCLATHEPKRPWSVHALPVAHPALSAGVLLLMLGLLRNNVRGRSGNVHEALRCIALSACSSLHGPIPSPLLVSLSCCMIHAAQSIMRYSTAHMLRAARHCGVFRCCGASSSHHSKTLRVCTQPCAYVTALQTHRIKNMRVLTLRLCITYCTITAHECDALMMAEMLLPEIQCSRWSARFVAQCIYSRCKSTGGSFHSSPSPVLVRL